ncbi:MAG: uroporphyrinogen decarboxylase family protein [Thermotogae bacterium]|jgi:hypothetical protein|nr:uroporphyrinogen decarboxylase family protein [Thermotogota bacterium]
MFTKKEMNLRVFQRKEIPYPFFQPRIEPWLWWHKYFNKMPNKYKYYSLLDLYDDLDISMRYIDYYTGMPSAIYIEYENNVKVKNIQKSEDELEDIIDTPYGQIVRRMSLTSDGNWRTSTSPIKNKDDLKKMMWFFKNIIYHFSEENFDKGSSFIGDRGYPQFFVPRSPYQTLHIDGYWMKFDDLIYAIMDFPEEVEDVMKAVDDSYDSLFEELIKHKDKVKIVNFGENIDVEMLSPTYFERYLIPYYEKRSNQLRKAGIYTHIHIDGHFKPILKYLKDLPFDGLEALTPLPQGDCSLEEMKEALGDKILLDGIPALVFLPSYSEEYFQETVEKVINLFYPKLVLGISDEIPEGAPEESVERVRWVSNYCKSLENKKLKNSR